MLAAVTNATTSAPNTLLNNDLKDLLAVAYRRTQGARRARRKTWTDRDVWAFVISENQKFEKAVFDGMRNEMIVKKLMEMRNVAWLTGALLIHPGHIEYFKLAQELGNPVFYQRY